MCFRLSPRPSLARDVIGVGPSVYLSNDAAGQIFTDFLGSDPPPASQHQRGRITVITGDSDPALIRRCYSKRRKTIVSRAAQNTQFAPLRSGSYPDNRST